MKPCGIILCGGQSKRMGQNKALLKLGNNFLIEHVINALLPICSEIILSTNNDDLDLLPYRKIKDKITGIGPIAGFYSALQETKTDIYFIVSCDSPFINGAFLNYLYSNLEEYEIALPVYKNKIQTVTGIFNKSIITEIEKQIENKNYVPVNIFENCNLKLLHPTEADLENLDSIFVNINNLDDYSRAVNLINTRV